MQANDDSEIPCVQVDFQFISGVAVWCPEAQAKATVLTMVDMDSGYVGVLMVCLGRALIIRANDFVFFVLFSRFEFDSRRRGFFLSDSNSWVVRGSVTHNVAVHVIVLWPLCTHTIPIRLHIYMYIYIF